MHFSRALRQAQGPLTLERAKVVELVETPTQTTTPTLLPLFHAFLFRLRRYGRRTR